MQCINNNDSHNNDCSDQCDDIIYFALRHEGLLYSKYTPADFKNKELFKKIK